MWCMLWLDVENIGYFQTLRHIQISELIGAILSLML